MNSFLLEGPLFLIHTKAYGQHFFFNLSRQNQNAIMWVEMLGFYGEAEKFEANLSLENLTVTEVFVTVVTYSLV